MKINNPRLNQHPLDWPCLVDGLEADAAECFTSANPIVAGRVCASRWSRRRGIAWFHNRPLMASKLGCIEILPTVRTTQYFQHTVDVQDDIEGCAHMTELMSRSSRHIARPVKACAITVSRCPRCSPALTADVKHRLVALAQPPN